MLLLHASAAAAAGYGYSCCCHAANTIMHLHNFKADETYYHQHQCFTDTHAQASLANTLPPSTARTWPVPETRKLGSPSSNHKGFRVMHWDLVLKVGSPANES